MGDILRPILSKGEEYSEPADPPPTGPRQDKRPSYDVNRKKLLGDVQKIKDTILATPREYIMDDVVINIKMRSDRSSKSDHPSMFIRAANMKQLGSKKWSKEVDTGKKKKVEIGKDIFLLTEKVNLQFIEQILSREEKKQAQGLIENIRSFEEIYIDNHKNILKNFDENWRAGRVEIILHSNKKNDDEVINRFYELVKKNNGNTKSIKIKTYKEGPIFVSISISMECLQQIIPFNHIRTAHTLNMRSLNEKMEIVYHKIPKSPLNPNLKSSIKIGVFDGGINSNLSYFNPYVEEYNVVDTQKHSGALDHGTAVISSALYGDLSQYDEEDNLPTPTISVESYRVFPLLDPEDIDLYEVINIIEEIVPNKKDIKVFNLSFGPAGSIDDDIISRFTYAIDELSKDNKRCFIIAVGNDGYMNDEDLARIQSPADSVNGVSVGCYKTENSIVEKTEFSCIGDGREGSKVKPDVAEFGGGDRTQMQFIGSTGEYKLFGSGTSFASPVVARKFAEILGMSSVSTPLTAKTLIIHTAIHPNKKHDKLLGYGIVADDIDKMLSCEKNKVTIIYEGTILPKSYAKLNIPFVENIKFKGKVRIDWTISICTPVNPNDSEDYTKTCIEDTCYINSFKYKMTHPNLNRQKTVHKIKNSELINELDGLGWKISKNPISVSSSENSYKPEQDRKKNFKWDTVVKRTTGNKNYKEVEKPYIVIHGMERGEKLSNEKIHYSAAITVEYIECEHDVYSDTLKIFDKLEQTAIRPINEIMVR